jgi:F-type H+-transporting ATPase subunit b
MPHRSLSSWRRVACETERKLQASLLLVLILLIVSHGALAQEPAPPVAGETHAPETSPAQPASTTEAGEQVEHPAEHAEVEHAEAEHGEAAHEEGVLPLIARLVNFGILAGALVYLLRSPLASYLRDRGAQIRGDLVNAAELKQTAAAQLEEIDRKMKALPGELDALRAQGAQEIAAEETRIRAAAAAERDRLLEQARRDIDQQVKVAERQLVSHAADLAVGVAEQRIKTAITDDDQKRLADRYVQQLKR